MTYLRFALAAATLSGCGLISSDVTNVSIALSPKMFTVDTSGWQVDQSAANLYLAMTCDPSQPAPNVCSSAANTACPMNCSGTCDSSSHTCDLGLDVAVHQGVDVAMEDPAIMQIQAHAKVTIDQITYAIADNTLDIATPPLTVYVAPMSVTNPSDAMAMPIGTVAAIPAMTVVPATNLAYTTGGQAALEAALGNYMVPFNVIVGATLVVKDGDPVPTGKLDASVSITGHASP
jgi:hypothetical protein